MSYQQKRTLVTLFSGVILFISYCVFLLQHYQSAEYATDVKAWAIAMLTFIGIAIVVMIIIQIIFHILLSASIAVKEQFKNMDLNGKITGKVDEKVIDKKIKLEMIEDERDKLIELKSLRVGYYVSGVGIIASIVALVLGYSPVVMLNMLFMSCMLSSILEGTVQYLYYSKD